jgi:hypothetical protein
MYAVFSAITGIRESEIYETEARAIEQQHAMYGAGIRRVLIVKPVTAPCSLNERESSGDEDNWPGSPCLIEKELCLTCGLKTAHGETMNWSEDYPVTDSRNSLTNLPNEST